MRKLRHPMVGAVLAFAFILAGCSDNTPVTDTASPLDEPREVQGAARAVLDGEEYDFILTTCVVNADHLRASGAGEAASGEFGAWLDLDMTKGEANWDGGVQIMLGTQLEGMDPDNSYRMLIADQDDYLFSVEQSDDGARLEFEGTARLGDGPSVPAQVSITCGDWSLDDATEIGTD